MKQITTALISCAGFGTRFLPITKTIQKEMLPILNRPIIDYIVSDCVRAGITNIIMVMNEHNYQPLHYFRQNIRLDKFLAKMNKEALSARFDYLHQLADFKFIKQTDTDNYGTAIPVKLAQSYLATEEAFLYLVGDDFIYGGSEYSLTKAMIDQWQTTEVDGVVAGISKPTAELSRYGVIDAQTDHGQLLLKRLVEKPALGTEPSNLINISKYILPTTIFEEINQLPPNPETGEYYITDAIQSLAATQKMLVYPVQETYLDGGSVKNWLLANLEVAWEQPELKTAIQEFIRQKS